MPPAQPASALPPAARGLVATSLVCASLALLLALLSLPRGIAGDELAILLGGIALATSVMFFLQTRSMTLPWSGERLAIHPDEAVVLVALYLMPPGSAVVVAAGATLLAQASLQKPLVKAAFNGSVVTLAAGASTLLFHGLLELGLTKAAALAAVPFAFTAVSQTLVGAMLTVLGRKPVGTLLRPQLGKSIIVAGTAGLVLGGLSIVLLQVHWIALVGVGALAFILFRAMAAEYRHESELAARRALNGAMQRLAGTADEENIISAVYDACREAFALRGFEVTLQHPDREPRTWVLTAGVPSKEPVSLVRAPLVTATGARVGELLLTVSARGSQRLREDEELASVFAGYLAAAAGQAEALRLLEEARERLKEAFDAAPDPILIVGPDGALVHTNAAGRRTFGRNVPEISESGEVSTPDGRTFEFVASRLHLEGGRHGAILIGRDVTERRRTDEILHRNERLSALGTLVAGVAHEINNPLMYMGGHLELAISDVKLLEGREDLPIDAVALRESLETTLKGARRIEFISKGLRTVARSSPARHEPVRVNRVVADAAELLEGKLPPHVRLTVDLDPRDPVVTGDPQELHQVVMNLAKNAVDATAEAGGRVMLQTYIAEGSVEVAIADEGPGIPPAARAKLFTPFYTTKVDGTGLGLPIVHSLVKAHRGEITVESEPGRGALFRVRLPRAQLAATQ